MEDFCALKALTSVVEDPPDSSAVVLVQDEGALRVGFGGGVDGSAGRVVRQVNGNGLVELVAQGKEDFGRGEAALLASRNHVDREVVCGIEGQGAVEGAGGAGLGEFCIFSIDVYGLVKSVDMTKVFLWIPKPYTLLPASGGGLTHYVYCAVRVEDEGAGGMGTQRLNRALRCGRRSRTAAATCSRIIPSPLRGGWGGGCGWGWWRRGGAAATHGNCRGTSL